MSAKHTAMLIGAAVAVVLVLKFYPSIVKLLVGLPGGKFLTEPFSAAA